MGSLVDSYPAVGRIERLIGLFREERDYANSRYQRAEAAACTESDRFEEQLSSAKCAAESARTQAGRDLAMYNETASREHEKMELYRDEAVKQLKIIAIEMQFMKAKEQLAAIEMREHDHSSCQECRSLEHKNDAAVFQIKELEAEVEHLTRELEKAQGSVTGYKNSFAIIDKILNEQQAEIAEQKTKIVVQEVEIARLKIRYGEIRVPDFSPEDFVEPIEAVKHLSSGQPLVMRIDVWVGGEHGTDTELALVKMNPDTPFKTVLEDLRHNHPLMALKQKDTGRYIFESDTPAHVSHMVLLRSVSVY